VWLDRLDAIYDDLRTAFFSLSGEEESIQGLEVAANFWQHWWIRGYWHDGLALLKRLLGGNAHTLGPHVWGRALTGAGTLAYSQGNIPTARSLLQEASNVLKHVGTPHDHALLLNLQGLVAFHCAQLEAAHALHKKALAISRAATDHHNTIFGLRRLARIALERQERSVARTYVEECRSLCEASGSLQQLAFTYTLVGDLAREEGDFERAREFHRQSLALCQQLRSTWGIAESHYHLGLDAYEQGDTDQAARDFTHGLTLAEVAGERLVVAWLIECLAGVAAVRGDPERALQLAGAAAALRQVLGISQRLPSEERRLLRWLSTVRRQFHCTAESAFWLKGQLMSQGEAVRCALDVGGSPAAQRQGKGNGQAKLRLRAYLASGAAKSAKSCAVLTPREEEVMALLCSGASNQAIARELRVSIHTVRRHVSNILTKLNASCRTEAAVHFLGSTYASQKEERSDTPRLLDELVDLGAAPLSQREREVLRLLMRGKTTRAIAEALSISTTTVRRHVANACRALGVNSRTEAITHLLISR